MSRERGKIDKAIFRISLYPITLSLLTEARVLPIHGEIGAGRRK